MSSRHVGTVVRGIRGPIIRDGDDLTSIVVDSLFQAVDEEKIEIRDRDVVAITESVVARSQGNYVSIEDISREVQNKYPSGIFAITFPILSRNRFSILLKGILKGAKKVYIFLSYPCDEVGNELVSLDLLDEKCINPFTDVLSEEQFLDKFGPSRHPFTGVDYPAFYHQIANEVGTEIEIVFGNDVRYILGYTKNVLCCDIHSRFRSKRLLKNCGADIVYGLDDICTSSYEGSGYNEEYGLLGSNKSTEEKVKLFPRNCTEFCHNIQYMIQQRTGKLIEVMVYGDGAFKDPVGKIWELADPVVSPGFTTGLIGTPNEVKLKYIADNDFKDMKGEELKNAVIQYIAKKSKDMKDEMVSMGTTPRRLTDLIGSLCDLTSGSGDKGTPFILIQGYFDTLSD